jgi:hypothetical protein
MGLRVLLSRDSGFWHVPLLRLNPIRYSPAQVVGTFCQRSNLLGRWVQPQSLEILSKSQPEKL